MQHNVPFPVVRHYRSFDNTARLPSTLDVFFELHVSAQNAQWLCHGKGERAGACTP